MAEIKNIIELVHLSEKLKEELRHNWTSSGRQESVAEHTWRISLMAMLLAPKLEKPINLEKALKMAIIHDMSEIDAGDVPAFEKQRKADNLSNEIATIKRVRNILGDKEGEEIEELWNEFETESSPEAKFVKALDKLEVRIQHNESDISTWNDIEFPRSLYVADKYCEYDHSLVEINKIIKDESREKITKSKKDLKEVESEAEKLRKE
jgi:putative hydrolase of HD superfamily